MGHMTNGIMALKDGSQSTRSKINPTKLSSLNGKEKDVTINFFTIYRAPRKPKITEVLGRYRAKRSKIKA